MPEVELTIVYEPGEDGWIVARVPAIPGVLTQGRTRQEARKMVLSALEDWLRFYVEDQAREADIPSGADIEPVQLTFA